MKSAISALFLLGKSDASGGFIDYGAPSEWAHHDGGAMCAGTFQSQSPINIRAESAVYAPDVCQPALNWTIDWNVHSFRVVNNGHSIALTPLTRMSDDDGVQERENEDNCTGDDGEEFITRSTNLNTIARLPNYFAPEGSQHTEFCLAGFHFHWGMNDTTGSEHLLDGEQFPLEAHFVHYSCARDNVGGALAPYPNSSMIAEAVEAGLDYHELAVVAFLFDVTEYDNPAFDAILSDELADEIEYSNEVDSSYPEYKVVDGLYLRDLIPMDFDTAGYYSYEGSLTTPPCTPIVRWHMSNSRSYIGRAQIERFRDLMATRNVSTAPDFRPPQYNKNTVYACMESQDALYVRSKAEFSVVVVFSVAICLMMVCFASLCYYRSIREANQPLLAPMPKTRPRVFSASGASMMSAPEMDGMDGHARQSSHLSVEHATGFPTTGHVSTPTDGSSPGLHHE